MTHPHTQKRSIQPPATTPLDPLLHRAPLLGWEKGKGPTAACDRTSETRTSSCSSMPQRRHPILLVITTTTALLLLACTTAAATMMYHTPRRTTAFAASGATKGWLRNSNSNSNPRQRARTLASQAAAGRFQSRRPSSLGFLSAVTMLAAPRGGWATTSTSLPTTGAAAAAATAGFCPAPFSTTATAGGGQPQTCMAASASSTVAAPPTDASAKKKLQPKYRLSYRQPDYWIRHTDMTFQIEADPVGGWVEGVDWMFVGCRRAVYRVGLGFRIFGVPPPQTRICTNH